MHLLGDKEKHHFLEFPLFCVSVLLVHTAVVSLPVRATLLALLLLLLQPKLGKVSNVVKAALEETLKSSKAALENAAIEAEMEKDKVDVTLPG